MCVTTSKLPSDSRRVRGPCWALRGGGEGASSRRPALPPAPGPCSLHSVWEALSTGGWQRGVEAMGFLQENSWEGASAPCARRAPRRPEH